MTNQQLLDLMLKTYYKNGYSYLLFGTSSAIKNAAEYLRTWPSEVTVDANILGKLIGYFQEELAEWDLSKKPSNSLHTLSLVLSDALTDILDIEGIKIQVNEKDIYDARWYNQFKIMQKIAYDAANTHAEAISHLTNSTLYFYLDDESKLYCFSSQIPRRIELNGEQFATIKQKLRSYSDFGRGTLALTPEETNHIKLHTSKIKCFPPIHTKNDEQVFSALLLKAAKIDLEKIPALKEFLNISALKDEKKLITAAKIIITLAKADKLAALTNIFEAHQKRTTVNEIKVKQAIFFSYWKLYEEKCFTEKNERCIVNLLTSFRDTDWWEYTKFEALTRRFLTLEQYLTDADKDLIISSDSDQARNIIEILYTLHSAKILTDEYRAIALHSTQLVWSDFAPPKNEFNVSISNILVKFKKAELLPQAKKLAITLADSSIHSAKQISSAVKLLSYLKKIDRLALLLANHEINTYHSFLEPAKIDKISEIFYFLNKLDKQHLLSADSFDFVVNNTDLFKNPQIVSAINNVPDVHLTQEVWNETRNIINENRPDIERTSDSMCSFANNLALYGVTEALARRRPLPPPPIRQTTPLRYQWNERQTSHAPSVEDTATTSWRQLEKRYPLSEEEIRANVRRFEDFYYEIMVLTFVDRLDESTCDAAITCINGLVKLADKELDDTVDKKDILRDPYTGFLTSKMLALIWKAVTDTPLHNSTSGINAKENLIRALANAQQGAYDGANGEACYNGKTHELLNGLSHIHPDVNIVLLDESTASELIIAHAETIFWNDFIQKQKENPRFIQSIQAEIQASSSSSLGNTTWCNSELKSWYEALLAQTQTSVIDYSRHQMTTANVSADKIVLLIQDITVPHNNERYSWMETGLNNLRADHYLLSYLTETLEKKAKEETEKFIRQRIFQCFKEKLLHNSADRDVLVSAMLAWMQGERFSEIIDALDLSAILFQEVEKHLQAQGLVSSGIPSNVSFKANDDLFEHIAFIFNTDSTGTEARHTALRQIKEWIEAHFKPNSLTHFKIIHDFYTIYCFESKLLRNREQILKAALLSEPLSLAVTQEIAQYYQTVTNHRGAGMSGAPDTLLYSIPQLEEVISDSLNTVQLEKLENFFAHWYEASKEKDSKTIKMFYTLLCEEKLWSRVKTVAENFATKSITKAESITETGEKKIECYKIISNYEMNCIILHAIATAPNLDENFVNTLRDAVTRIKTLGQNDGNNAQQLKKDSYPESLVNQLDYLLGLNTTDQRPSMILLPHQVETIEEWKSIAEILGKTEAEETYRRLQSTVELRLFRDLQNRGNQAKDFEVILSYIPKERHAAFQAARRILLHATRCAATLYYQPPVQEGSGVHTSPSTSLHDSGLEHK